jgi:hypothetical protein
LVVYKKERCIMKALIRGRVDIGLNSRVVLFTFPWVEPFSEEIEEAQLLTFRENLIFDETRLKSRRGHPLGVLFNAHWREPIKTADALLSGEFLGYHHPEKRFPRCWGPEPIAGQGPLLCWVKLENADPKSLRFFPWQVPFSTLQLEEVVAA